jgi:hypothetical protein
MMSAPLAAISKVEMPKTTLTTRGGKFRARADLRTVFGGVDGVENDEPGVFNPAI